MDTTPKREGAMRYERRRPRRSEPGRRDTDRTPPPLPVTPPVSPSDRGYPEGLDWFELARIKLGERAKRTLINWVAEYGHKIITLRQFMRRCAALIKDHDELVDGYHQFIADDRIGEWREEVARARDDF